MLVCEKCGFGQMYNLALLNPFKKIVLVLHRHSLCRIRVTVSSWIFCFYMLTVKLKTISCLTLKPFIMFSLVKLIHTFESFSLYFDRVVSFCKWKFQGRQKLSLLTCKSAKETFCTQLWRFHLLMHETLK